MTISEFRLFPFDNRRQIACFGDAPVEEDARAFRQCQFLVSVCTELDLANPEFISTCTAVVFTQDKNRPATIASYLDKYSKKLLDHGCRIIVRPARLEDKAGIANDTGKKIVRNAAERLKLPYAGAADTDPSEPDEFDAMHRNHPPLPHLYICDAQADWRSVLYTILPHSSGQPANLLNLDIKVEKKDGEEIFLDKVPELLVRRAFWNCSSVRLIELAGGRSGDSVYQAFATLANPRFNQGTHGVRLSYFVKMGNRADILREQNNWGNVLQAYVPFHLGPNLKDSRCYLGADKGILVGDFVEESETLVKAANAGRARAAISCLFNKSLHSMYLHSREDFARPFCENLVDFFPKSSEPPPSERFEKARRLGATRDIEQLTALFKLSASSPTRVGPIHGDLHAANVLVRATDAITIDFAKAKRAGPLLYDFASLEAGLLVDGFTNDEREGTVLLESIMPLFECVPLIDAEVSFHPAERSSWFYASVRQIRSYARQFEYAKGQYATALATALLKKASSQLQFDEPLDCHRAMAYVIGERVLVNHFVTHVASHTLASGTS